MVTLSYIFVMVIAFYTCIAALLVISVLICLLVLLQEGRSSGFGLVIAWEGADAFLGTGGLDLLRRATAWLGSLFLLLCIVLSLWTSFLGQRHLEEKFVPSSALLR